jgi:hypothetical protein
MSVKENKKRLKLISLCLLVIVLGIASRMFPFESVILNKYLGDALYAILLYLIITIFAGNLNPLARGGIAFAGMIMIELFQLTQIPLTMSQSENIPARYISRLLGTVFSWHDILAYWVGIVISIVCEKIKLVR